MLLVKLNRLVHLLQGFLLAGFPRLQGAPGFGEVRFYFRCAFDTPELAGKCLEWHQHVGRFIDFHLFTHGGQSAFQSIESCGSTQGVKQFGRRAIAFVGGAAVLHAGFVCGFPQGRELCISIWPLLRNALVQLLTLGFEFHNQLLQCDFLRDFRVLGEVAEIGFQLFDFFVEAPDLSFDDAGGRVQRTILDRSNGHRQTCFTRFAEQADCSFHTVEALARVGGQFFRQHAQVKRTDIGEAALNGSTIFGKLPNHILLHAEPKLGVAWWWSGVGGQGNPIGQVVDQSRIHCNDAKCDQL